MNSKFKGIVIIIISIVTIMILQTSILAVEEENNQQNTNTTTNQQQGNTSNTTTKSQENTLKTTNTTNTTNKQKSTSTKTTGTTKKSNNANLKNLGIKPEDFKGFNPNTTTYNVTVSENLESVEIYATAANSKASITGIGKKNLEKGKNVENIVVTAEDGTQKTYTINIVRGGDTQEEANDTEETTEIKEGLSNIAISGVELSPKFDRSIYYYTAKYIGENEKLNIQAVPTESTYTVEIVGNENLQEGENIITILVSDQNAENIATYQITIEKSLVDNEKLTKEEQEKQKEEMKKILLLITGGILIIIIIAVIIIIKKKRNKAIAEEFSGMNYVEKDNSDKEKIKKQKINTEDAADKAKRQKNKEDEKEKLEKERAKKEFLNEYNSNKNKDYSSKVGENSKKKGKRFK